MNYSTSVFLINPKIRAVVATYEQNDSAPRTTFKTIDPKVKTGDFIIVPTDTRHKMTVCKVVDVDVDVDFDSPVQMNWVIGVVDHDAYDELLAQEKTAIEAIKSAEMRRKRDALRESMFADHQATLKTLAIASSNGDSAKGAEFSKSDQPTA